MPIIGSHRYSQFLTCLSGFLISSRTYLSCFSRVLILCALMAPHHKFPRITSHAHILRQLQISYLLIVLTFLLFLICFIYSEFSHMFSYLLVCSRSFSYVLILFTYVSYFLICFIFLIVLIFSHTCLTCSHMFMRLLQHMFSPALTISNVSRISGCFAQLLIIHPMSVDLSI